MTEKELDKILTSVLGQKPNVSGKREKKKPTEEKKQENKNEKEKKKN